MSDFKASDYRLTKQTEAQRGPLSYPLAPESSYGLVPEIPQTSGVVSFLSNSEREGKWVLPRHLRALSVMGNIELDLREAVIGLGVSVIEAVAVLGNIEITVPPDLAVEVDGDTLLGSFALKYQGRVNPSPTTGDRKVRITGTAYAANVEIHVKGPDEAMLARLRRNLGFGPEEF